MPKNLSLGKILIIGSGPIIVGQGCEFDYSGTQAARALREEGFKVVLVNSNPATIMTDPTMADHVYLLPLTKSSIIKILEEHKIDAVLPTMGGQMALNLAMTCAKAGVWKKYNVKMLGANPKSIDLTENRELFRKYMQKLGFPTCEGASADSVLAGKEIAQQIGYPLIIRPSYTLGGSGGGEVSSAQQLEKALQTGLSASPVHEVLVEKSIRGWKEYELELLQDQDLQTIVVCSIENIDAVGIHTGDSITVAPTMTLPDTVYQRMRSISIRILRGLPGFVGGCNVQFAVDPKEEDKLIIIEVNPRVSRSSALASKATGYPIAKIATKLAIGYRLDELKNQVTQHTSAFFEPVLDYVVVKIPRWNFDKFKTVSGHLGLQMQAVGEVMAIGCNFAEALQKAIYSLEIRLAEAFKEATKEELIDALRDAKWNRLFAIFHAFRKGISCTEIAALSGIDPWFLQQIEGIVQLEAKLEAHNLSTVPVELLSEAKHTGCSDARLAVLLREEEEAVRSYRLEQGIQRNYCMVDTCAAEFRAETPYYYSTFTAFNESKAGEKKKIVILGSGPNRIGQGIEFDYCCVHGVQAVQACGYEAIMINCNPETVSTDFDIADKLYFEPLNWEYVRDILALEKPEGVIVQLGGQTALKLARQIEEAGIPIVGTPFSALDLAEDRVSFSTLLKVNNVPYPAYGMVTNKQSALELAATLGFPLLVRPSYVLGGENMKIVINEQELEEHITRLLRQTDDNHRILLDHFLEDAIEAEVDAICDGKEVHIIGIMQHIEPAGIHSGDSYSVLPPYSLKASIIEQIKQYTDIISRRLHIIGFVNIQFAIQGENIYVIEANPRASRTVPFICKAHDIAYVHHAISIMLGHKSLADCALDHQTKGYAIKEPIFSFDKFPQVNKTLGPEMKSTGETIYFVDDIKDDYFTKIYTERNMHLSR